DDQGRWTSPDRDVTLAMRRLAIIDMAGGHQPMRTADGRFTIVYNGEIYNASALRAGLEESGARFRSDHSDTEVLLELFAREGLACLPRLNGMFAFAIHDRERRQVTLVRDRLGIKPLYWHAENGRLAFASELKSLLALPSMSRRVDGASLFHYMSLMYVPGTATIIEGVSRLAPGAWLTYDLTRGSIAGGRWWRPPPATAPTAAREAEAQVRQALEIAVADWSIADVPVGCSLSGGLDSSAIVGLLARAGHRVRTYSVGFAGPGEAAWDELPLAREVARRWGTEHREIVVDPESLLDDLPAMVWHLDEPYGGGLPSWAVFREMAREVKVGMTGTGGDELFGNYGKWRELEGGLFTRLVGARDVEQRFRREVFERYYYLSDASKRATVFSGWAAGVRDTADWLFAEHFRPGEGAARERIARMDIGTQLAEEFLMMTDRFSMAHSIEARTPFLDHRLVELVLGLDSQVRTSRRDLKGLLRRAVADLLPAPLLRAPKKGFVIPLALWLRGRLRPLAERLLAPERLSAQGWFRPAFHAHYVRPHLDGHADHTQKVWAALMFQLWHLVHLEGGGDRPAVDLRALSE
ncbi:MAG: asparagine synthase (glutamine-hydrolyzing), partial [Burkholderiales bacterium]|nr:asparagine synthase (glutamine-hydrolyzing) [Burkholderiales bacterium]